jgi:phosphatidylglycerophosphatase A
MKKWRENLYIMLSTSFGLGFSPIASGTVGSLPAVALFVLVAMTQAPEMQIALLIAALVLSVLLSAGLGPWAENYWGKKDPGYFVMDEWAGFFLTVVIFYSPYQGKNVLLVALWAFLATRFFDILKPPPCRRLEKIPGGWGIVLDDLGASVYAGGSLYLGAWLFPWLFGG